MLRLLGAALIISGTTGIGLCMRAEFSARIKWLETVHRLFLSMRGEVVYSRLSLPEACLRTAGRIGGPCGAALTKIHGLMRENRGVSFTELWREAMGEALDALPLSKEDKALILSFGDCAGYMDGQAQAMAMEDYAGRLEETISALKAEKENRSRMALCLGLMSGVLFVIILL